MTKNENRFGSLSLKNFCNIFSYNREINPFTYRLGLDSEDYEKLYDLIQAGLVEKYKYLKVH